jgi:hypothetical protein
MAVLPTFSRAFSDLNVQEGSPTEVAGHDAAYTPQRLPMRARGAAFPKIFEVWIVPGRPIMLLIGTDTRADDRKGTRAEVRWFVDSLTIR